VKLDWLERRMRWKSHARCEMGKSWR